MGKQNLALFEQTMKMFSPFPVPGATPAAKGEEKPAAAEGDMKDLNERINSLQKVVEDLTRNRKS
jgi:polyhydroxyalkanoate synthesis regulator protein